MEDTTYWRGFKADLESLIKDFEWLLNKHPGNTHYRKELTRLYTEKERLYSLDGKAHG